MYCEQCGKHNEDGKQFCYNCGAPLIPVEKKRDNPAGNGKIQPPKRQLAGAEKNPSFYAGRSQSSPETKEGEQESAGRSKEERKKESKKTSSVRRERGKTSADGTGKHSEKSASVRKESGKPSVESEEKQAEKRRSFAVTEEELAAMEKELHQLDKGKNPLLALIVALLVFAAVVAVLMIRLPKMYGAKQEAAGFETAMLSGKWEDAYGYLLFEEETSPYLTQSLFGQVMARKGASGFRDLQVEEMGTTDGKKVFSATYETAEGIQTDYITLKQTGEKKFLFMDQWKVDPDTVCVSDVTIAVPSEASLSLNGVAVDADPVIKEEEHSAEYTFSRLFKGIWTARLEAENRAPYQTDIEVTADSGNGNISLTGAELYPDQELMDSVLNQFAQDYQAILEASVNREDFSVVEKYFAKEAIQEGRAQNMYANACSQAFNPETGSGIVKYELSDISANFVPIVKSGYAKAGDLVMEIQSIMTYTYIDDGLEKSDTQQSVGLLCYHQEDGQWKIQSFS